MSLSVYLRWEGMDQDAQYAASRNIDRAAEADKGWRVGYSGFLHDFNGPGTVAGTLVTDWFFEPARETPLDVAQLCRNLPAALHRLYESDEYSGDGEYRTAMLTGFVVRAMELHAAGLPLMIFVSCTAPTIRLTIRMTD